MSIEEIRSNKTDRLGALCLKHTTGPREAGPLLEDAQRERITKCAGGK